MHPLIARTDERPGGPLTIADIVDLLLEGPPLLRVTAFDGSAAGPEDAPLHLHIANRKAVAYMATAPGSLGLARAYVSGDIEITGVHPGDPYELLVSIGNFNFRRPDPMTAARIVRAIGVKQLIPPPPPPQEVLPDWRRRLEGLRHSKERDAEAIHHHYDVSNRFYELLLGESMTYTCAVYPSDDATLEEAQFAKYDLVARKLDLKPGMRLLDVGCGWGGMVRHAAKHYGVKALGVTLSKEQAEWAQAEIKRQGLEGLAEVRFTDYRDVTETAFDAVSSIGLTEHIGVKNYPAYFEFLAGKLKTGARLLNHCITRPDNVAPARAPGGFIDRYVFPDGELTGAGKIISTIQDVGLEVRHEENLREHYAKTCAAWCDNLVEHWDECVAEAGLATAKVWGLYLAGSQMGFETRQIELHQVLAVKAEESGAAHMPLRPTWAS